MRKLSSGDADHRPPQVQAELRLWSPGVEEEIQTAASAGESLDAATRAYMEPRFGHDFSQVRIHADEQAAEEARALNARAYTVGQEIFFGQGEYAPQSAAGRWLLAHELTHVVQQSETLQQAMPAGGSLLVQAQEMQVSEPGEPQEREATAIADQVLSGQGARVTVSQSATRGRLWRYQAGEAGHGGIEEEALTAVGFSYQDARSVYFGNWLRDLSQIPPKGLRLIQILTLGEFGRPVRQEDLGTYVPSEHLDNPEGGGTVEDPCLTPAERAEVEKKLSPEQKAAYDEEQAHLADIKHAAADSGLPEYIERGKFHAKRKLEEAIVAGRAPEGEGMAAMGNALHAIEDYYSHSNFVEVALWILKSDGTITATQYNALVKSQLGNDVALIGGHDPRNPALPGIITGTYAPGANNWVSRLELICTETENGELTRSFIKGYFRMMGLTERDVLARLAEVGWHGGQAAGSAPGSLAGGVIGGELGGVGGAVTGAAEGATEGWRTHSGLSAVWHGITGFFSGAASGAVSGTASGYRTGAGIGGTALGAVGEAIGGGLGALAGLSLDRLISLFGTDFFLRVLFPAILAARAAALAAARSGILEQQAKNQTAQAAAQARANGLGPTHSEIAKDSPDHPLFGISRMLAVEADKQIGKAMQTAWTAMSAAGGTGPAPATITDPVTGLVDKFVSHPARDPWWRATLIAALKSVKI
ncbi:MAG: DUF4157 domain-containing protein [Thermogemmatispora sp.]|uniref:eCIS core domain-containing protein n=1 Tax=Thermogemmatispora sp. TaxID=1968838 RepID=UPI001A017A6B|nr:DUF4157 domain-containing protein [Thermogemmatispora sp.]MBE3565043.1 DUF4157 domain-containing protein [Thermogemmatispora sp.]